MSGRRLHSLTAVLLAVLYGAVGFTGDSIHYLVSDVSSLWATQPGAGGYFHIHAPDFHGHYHRHIHHGAHSHHHVMHRTDDATDLGVELTCPSWTHEPHACPALALVSTLKMS